VLVELTYGFANPYLPASTERARDLVLVSPSAQDLAAALVAVRQATAAFPPRGEQGARALAAVRASRARALTQRDEGES
jgi:hypothetical protein